MPGRMILAMDPGESTGWFARGRDGILIGGTLPQNHQLVATIINVMKPDVVVVERFNLFPGMAKTMAWNTFYPCEVIGVIRLVCQLNNIKMVEQAPGVKKFAGPFEADWDEFKERLMKTNKVTEHVKDAYLHYKYYIRNSRDE